MRAMIFEPGDTIISEGDDGSIAYLIIAGSVEVIVGEGPRAKSVGTLGAGEVFSEMSLIDPGPRSATVKARSRTECVTTTYDELGTSLQENPERAIAFMKTLVSRLLHMNELFSTLQPGKRRLADVFNEWLESHDDPKKQQKMLHIF